MFGAWDASIALSTEGANDRIRVEQFIELESIIAKWYEAGKLEATGYVYYRPESGTPTVGTGTDHRLKTVCQTWELDEADRITAVHIKSGYAGVSELDF